jgi:hypothetical protein
MKLHLQELNLLESRMNLSENQSQKTFEELQKQVKANESTVAKEQKEWKKRMESDKPLAKRAQTADEFPTFQEFQKMGRCKGNKECDCCDDYADAMIEHFHLELAMTDAKNMPEGRAKRKEIWRRLEFLMSSSVNASHFKNFGASRCGNQCSSFD